jgi:alkaline phosphatase
MKRTLLAATLAMTFANAANAAGEAKNIIFFLGDGMVRQPSRHPAFLNTVKTAA